MINVAPGTDVVQSFVAENNAQLFGPGQLGWGTETMYFCNDSLNNGSCDIGSGNQVDVSITSIEIAPGQEITVCINRELRVNSYLPKDGQSLPSNSWVLTAKLERNMDLI
jgi:hypothetical protein